VIETLGDILRNNAYKFPDETAYVYGDQVVTFRGHYDRANQLASALYDLGLRRQDRVSILAQNTLEFMEAFGACELAGFIAATVRIPRLAS
jgi:acyl-CoA synthetase (AMP-forming)/AMP-acid ligase II